MGKTVLFSTDLKTAGQLITLPVVGDVQFDLASNSIEIDSDKVTQLLAKNFGFELQENDPTQDISNAEMLAALTPEELADLLSAYPKNQTKKLNGREEIVAYLLIQMQK